jgi:phosphoribosylamine--glycine ligase
MINILLVGSGAREVAMARKIKESSLESSLFCVAPSTNPQIKKMSFAYFEQSLDDIFSVVAVAKKISANIAIIGPENPLELGLVDALEKEGIACVGPRRAVAKIETSKAFARNILDSCAPEKNPKRREFSSLDGCEGFLKHVGGDYVIKYDGLMGGKGVKISGEHLLSVDDALLYAKSIVDFGGSFLVEERLLGEEFSLMSFCDGEHCAHMPVVQDHKRAFEGDVGPNTGGMGTYSFGNHSLPFLSEKNVLDAQKTNEKVALELEKQTGQKFRGFFVHPKHFFQTKREESGFQKNMFPSRRCLAQHRPQKLFCGLELRACGRSVPRHKNSLKKTLRPKVALLPKKTPQNLLWTSHIKERHQLRAGVHQKF